MHCILQCPIPVQFVATQTLRESNSKLSVDASLNACRNKWATNPGPYQSPGFFPKPFPILTKLCKDKGLFLDGLSPNHLIILRWYTVVSLWSGIYLQSKNQYFKLFSN